MRRTVHKFFLALTGVVLFAVSYSWFLIPCGLYSGGFTGIAQLIGLFMRKFFIFIWQKQWIYRHYFLDYKRSIVFAGISQYWKEIFLVLSWMCLCTIRIAYYHSFPSEPLLDSTLLNVIIGGILSGAGVGITLREGGSGGGIDIVGMYVTKKIPGSSVEKLLWL